MRGNVTLGLTVVTSAVLVQLLAAGHSGIVPRAHAAPAGQLFSDSVASLERDVIEIKVKKRGRSPAHDVPPIAPSYTYYDYPYYYSRGHYPTHIRPGFIYFGYPYLGHTYSHHPEHGVRCTTRHRACVAGWSKRSPRRAKAH